MTKPAPKPKKAIARHKLTHGAKKRKQARFQKIARPPGIWIGHASKSKLDGAESRELLIKQACLELDARGYRLRDIATAVSERFKMGRVMAPTTICMYLKNAREMLSNDIKEVQMILRTDAFNEMELVRIKYFEIATAEAVCIKKTKIVDGEKVEYIDQNAFDKQIDALNGYLKVVHQQAQLMGLYLKEIPELVGEGNTADGVKTWILNNINIIQQSAVPIGSKQKGFPMIDLNSTDSDADVLDFAKPLHK